MLHWKIIAAGSPSLRYAKLGLEEYATRLRHYAKVEMVFLPMKKSRPPGVDDYYRQADGGTVIVLDERGESWGTTRFAEKAGDWEMRGPRRVNLLLGPSDGHGEEARRRADHVLSLSPFTMQHELALVVALEQIYRVHTILRGEPYHRV